MRIFAHCSSVFGKGTMVLYWAFHPSRLGVENVMGWMVRVSAVLP